MSETEWARLSGVSIGEEDLFSLLKEYVIQTGDKINAKISVLRSDVNRDLSARQVSLRKWK